jgi:glycosyltransferase involved in cell wall biosynthesis
MPNDALKPYSQQWFDYQKVALGEAACNQLGFFVFPESSRLSIVIPFYNEQATIDALVRSVSKSPFAKQVILVDDGSTDQSPDLVSGLIGELADETNSFQLITHERNRGKGAAVRTGLKHVQGDIIIIQDADLEYDPSEYPRLIQPIIAGNADVVFGSRFMNQQSRPAGYYWSYVGNRWITRLSNAFTNLHLTDMETCYKVLHKTVVEAIAPTLTSNGFSIEPEITTRIARAGFRVFEVPIHYQGRSFKDGKKIRFRDAAGALWAVIKFGLTVRSTRTSD